MKLSIILTLSFSLLVIVTTFSQVMPNDPLFSEQNSNRNSNRTTEFNMFKGVYTIKYHVDNIQKAKEWYSNVLGYEPYFDKSFYVGFNVGGYELGLDPDTTGLLKGNNLVAYWGVDKIENALKRLIKLGAILNDDIQDVGGEIKIATVLDPFGNIFGIIENPHFKLK